MNILSVRPGQSILIPRLNMRGRVTRTRRWSVNGVEKVDVFFGKRWATVSPNAHVVVL